MSPGIVCVDTAVAFGLRFDHPGARFRHPPV